MRTTESSHGNDNGAKERDRALERTLRDALALAVSKKVADQALRQARNKAHSAGRRDLRRVAGHLAGYGTLLRSLSKIEFKEVQSYSRPIGCGVRTERPSVIGVENTP